VHTVIEVLKKYADNIKIKAANKENMSMVIKDICYHTAKKSAD
jgi:hypothetical protein